MDVFPIYLKNLANRKAVLIGGNHEAESKAKQLIEHKATFTVISPILTPQLHQWAEEEKFTWLERTYRSGDLEGAFMAIVADFVGDINEQVYREAQERNILVNVLEDAENSNFAFGSNIKQKSLTVSVSTGGTAPALANPLRQRFEKEFKAQYGTFLKLVQKLKKPMVRHYPDFEHRKKLWHALVHSEVLNLLSVKQVEEAHQRAAEIVGEEVLSNALEPKLQH